MKAMGPIPPFFRADRDGMLTIGGRSAEALVLEAGGTPLFVYDAAIVRAQVDTFRQAMPPEVQLHYAIKANPFPPLVALLAGLTDGLDVASAAEMELALSSGAKAEHVSFAGPGKRDEELAAAIRAGVTVNLESRFEAERVVSLGQALGARPRVAIRVNPPFGLKGSGMKMGGAASPFGVDSEGVPELLRWLLSEAVQWQGYHVYAGSQSLDPSAISAMQSATVELVAQLSDEMGVTPALVNLGGGFGIPYHSGQERLDVAAIGSALGEVLERRADVLRGSRFAVELGRWLVGECGVYLSRISDVKRSRGRTFLVCDGGLHHQLAATGNLGAVVRRNYPLALAQDFGGEADEEPVSVVGPLCTPLDLLGDEVALPPASVGELVAVFCAGAYGLTASPSGFLSQPAAQEVLV